MGERTEMEGGMRRKPASRRCSLEYLLHWNCNVKASVTVIVCVCVCVCVCVVFVCGVISTGGVPLPPQGRAMPAFPVCMWGER